MFIVDRSQTNQALISFEAKWNFPQDQSNRLKQKQATVKDSRNYSAKLKQAKLPKHTFLK
jgi:hypothetical protein